MKLVCAEHGEIESATADGYSLGHRTPVDGPNERDLEGIKFEVTVEDKVEVEPVEERAENYLSKFADWEEKLEEALRNAEPDTMSHAECWSPIWLVEDDEVTIFDHDDHFCVLVATGGSPVVNVDGEAFWADDLVEEDRSDEGLEWWADRLRDHLDEEYES